MIGYDKDDYWKDAPAIADGNYNLWRLMIDKNYQNRGYGKQAVELALRFIRTFPCGKADFCWLSYEPENAVAKSLYASFGIYRDRRKGRRRANCRIKTLRQLPVCRTEKLLKTKYRRPVKAVSLKKICCFFCCPFGKIAKSPVVGSEARKSCLPRLANFKTRWCRE